MSKMTKTEINRGIQEVFEKCLDLIYLYEPPGCYNRVPEGAVETDISEYMDNRFAGIRTAIRTIFESNKDVAESLMQIVTEFEFFARSCEVPGVVDRWRQLNPSIQYFDTAFDLVDCALEVYEKISMGLTNLKLKCYPTEGIICE